MIHDTFSGYKYHLLLRAQERLFKYIKDESKIEHPGTAVSHPISCLLVNLPDTGKGQGNRATAGSMPIACP